jgi:hypothetical protein
MPRAKKKPHIRTVDTSYLSKRREDFERAIRNAFKGSHFLDRRINSDSVVNSSIKNRHYHEDKRSLVALDENGNIQGAVFHIPIKNRYGGSADYGWFFTAPHLSTADRIRLADRMIGKAHNLMREGGFDKVSVSIGTKEGQKYLRKRHGYRVGEHDRERAFSLWEKNLKDEETQ